MLSLSVWYCANLLWSDLGSLRTVLESLLNVTSELCNNVRDHSHDPGGGMVLMQSYRKRNHFEVVLSVTDMGIGVPKSLEPLLGGKVMPAAEVINLALQGASSRRNGRGGDGLPTVCQIALACGGSVLLRSFDGMVRVERNGSQISRGLCFFPGTQLQVELKSV